jgi:SSS family solute:Na+ symporter
MLNRYIQVLMTKIGIVIGILITIWLGYSLPIGVVARGTALFFGLCASTFLPAYTFALYWKKATKTGIISGILSGFCISAFWIVFVQGKEAKALGLCKIIFNKDVLLSAPWNNINVIVIALPLTFIITLLISLFTKKYDEQHLNRCGFK